jgi:hypothetical protein
MMQLNLGAPSEKVAKHATSSLRRRAVMRAIFALLLVLVGLLGTGSHARAYSAGCGEIPIVPGIPPWGFHTGTRPDGTGAFARGHGDINLDANTVSGIICQERRFDGGPTRAITMTVTHYLDYHSHYATMWGYPGNIMKIHVRVVASSDPGCKVGTVGRATLFASYNGVRSDSVQFFFPAACKRQSHLYHGPQVNNQVPPL